VILVSLLSIAPPPTKEPAGEVGTLKSRTLKAASVITIVVSDRRDAPPHHGREHGRRNVFRDDRAGAVVNHDVATERTAPDAEQDAPVPVRAVKLPKHPA
jgi:hypothetical protein